MNPIYSTHCNYQLGAPEDWDDTKGECINLPVRVTDDTIESWWWPSSEELQSLNMGIPIKLTVAGKIHPPVMISVERE